jgi:hypothetical protein
MLWTHVGRTTLTVAVKATFALAESGMTLVAPDKLVIWERLSEEGALMEDVDFVPYKPRAEVHLIGKAHSSTPVTHLVARLCVRSNAQVVIDKSVRVFGDRVGVGEPSPFQSMALDWRRSVFDAMRNPVGVAPGSGRAPNLYDPDDPNGPIAFGAIPRQWPARARFVGQSSSGKNLDLCGPQLELPKDVSWGYFLGTSEDQQASSLKGNEHLYLQNLVEGRPQFATQLPQARAVGVLTTAAGAQTPLEFRLDTLIVDTDRMRASLVFRATLPFPPELASAGCRVVTGVELAGQAVDLTRVARASHPPREREAAPSPTRMIDEASVSPETQRVDAFALSKTPIATPIAAPQGPESSTKILQSPNPNTFDFEPETAAPDGTRGIGGTLALTPEAAQQLIASRQTPSGGGPTATPHPSSPPIPPRASPPTVGMSLGDFSRGAPRPSPVAAPAAPAHVPTFGGPTPVSGAPLPAFVAPPGIPPPAGVASAAAQPPQAWGLRPEPTMSMPANQPAFQGTAPVLVVRAGGEYAMDDEDSAVGSTMAMSPESAAKLLAKPQKTAPPTSLRSTARTSPPNPPPAPPPPPPADLPRQGTMEMDSVPDSEQGGGTMVLEVNLPDRNRR